MSTKTTFKRVALVAVAALGFGLLSVVPSSAAISGDTMSLSSATTTITLGSSATNVLTQSFIGANSDTLVVMTTVKTNVTGNAAVPFLGTGNSGTGGYTSLVAPTSPTTVNIQATLTDTVTVGTSGTVSGTYNVSFKPTVAGTYVIRFAAYNGTAANQLAGTVSGFIVADPILWTVVVDAAPVVATTVGDSTSTSILNAASVATGSSDATITVAAGSAITAVATIVVTPKTSGVVSTGSTSISATITGPGTLTASGSSTAAGSGNLKSVSFDLNAAGAAYVHVYGDGTTGSSTVTVKVGGVTVGTETVIFSGAAASAVATVVKPVLTSGSGAAAFDAVTAIVKDAAGNVVAGKTVYAVSGTTTVFASTSAVTTSAGKATFSLTGLAAGTSTVTVQDVAAGSTATWSAAAVSVRAGTDIGASVVMSLDKATYSQGEAAVVTVTVKDAAGNLVADGTYAPFSAAATSTRVISGGSLPGTSHVTTGSANGTVTYAINVPTTSGAFTISATAGSGWTGTFSATATVSQSAAEIANADAIAAAADAAAEATDAANAATDAANAAAEAADAATAAAQDAADAVATLGTQVAELVAGLKAQIAAQKAAITALTNLVIKIQKKLKA